MWFARVRFDGNPKFRDRPLAVVEDDERRNSSSPIRSKNRACESAPCASALRSLGAGDDLVVASQDGAAGELRRTGKIRRGNSVRV